MKHHKPVTPSMRSFISSDRSALWKDGPVKFLSKRKISSGGRNNLGRITCRHRGGGHKKDIRTVDFRRIEADAVVERIEYDPNRSSLIALITSPEGSLSYIIAPEGIKVGDRVRSGADAPIENGNCLPLYKIPVGTVLHNIELKPGKGGQLARSAGSYGQLVSKGSGYSQIKLRSSEVRLVSLDCKATIGTVSNAAHRNVSLGKAGRARWMGRRPVVRGVAMNPVDHPHGGGEGKSSGGRHPCTPWGKGTKGKKSPRKKSAYKYIVKRRSK